MDVKNNLDWKNLKVIIEVWVKLINILTSINNYKGNGANKYQIIDVERFYFIFLKEKSSISLTSNNYNMVY